MLKLSNSINAFTLAEILITLAIIGIVATLTIPNIIQNYKKKEIETKLPRIYSMVNQAILISEIENGSVENWGINDFDYNINKYNDILEWFQKYMAKYLKYNNLKQSDNGDILVDGKTGDQNLLIYLSDGSILEIRNNLRDMYYYLDEKALKNPFYGKNKFSFRFDINDKVVFRPYDASAILTREWLMKRCIRTANNTENIPNDYCTRLIQYDGWKIKNDYPIKF